jgi:hypothetical protein
LFHADGEILTQRRKGAKAQSRVGSSNLDRVLSLMKKYSDTPMDFVDACQVVMTEEKSDCRLITIDSDFQIYRRFERQTIPLIAPVK